MRLSYHQPHRHVVAAKYRSVGIREGGAVTSASFKETCPREFRHL